MSSIDSVLIVGAVGLNNFSSGPGSFKDSLLVLGLFLVDANPVFCLFEIVASKKCSDLAFQSSSGKLSLKRYTDWEKSWSQRLFQKVLVLILFFSHW